VKAVAARAVSARAVSARVGARAVVSPAVMYHAAAGTAEEKSWANDEVVGAVAVHDRVPQPASIIWPFSNCHIGERQMSCLKSTENQANVNPMSN
jgi:molybdopterin biosynthesis enzyme